jgi:hypothetical protein
MVNQFLSGFERDFSNQEELSNSLCNQCNQAITNPLCHNCLGEDIESWLSFYPNLKRNLLPKIKKYIKQVNNSALNAVNCISCKNKKAALCPYCFTEGVFNILKKNKIDNQVIGDFLTIFNFDQEHEGYIKEAIKSGIY